MVMVAERAMQAVLVPQTSKLRLQQVAEADQGSESKER
jgi:hypothetical protein